MFLNVLKFLFDDGEIMADAVLIASTFSSDIHFYVMEFVSVSRITS